MTLRDQSWSKKTRSNSRHPPPSIHHVSKMRVNPVPSAIDEQSGTDSASLHLHPDKLSFTIPLSSAHQRRMWTSVFGKTNANSISNLGPRTFSWPNTISSTSFMNPISAPFLPSRLSISHVGWSQNLQRSTFASLFRPRPHPWIVNTKLSRTISYRIWTFRGCQGEDVLVPLLPRSKLSHLLFQTRRNSSHKFQMTDPRRKSSGRSLIARTTFNSKKSTTTK